MKPSLVLTRRKLFSGIGLVVSVLLIVTFSTQHAQARGKKKEPEAPHQTVIASLTPTSVTVKEDKVTKTFSISNFTEVTVNGQRATVADLKPGMFVSVTLRDPGNASRIVATGP